MGMDSHGKNGKRTSTYDDPIQYTAYEQAFTLNHCIDWITAKGVWS